MDVSGSGKSPNATLSFRYNANNEELEELYHMCDDDPPTPQCEPSPSGQSENASPKKTDKSSSILDKYFKSIRPEKAAEKVEDAKTEVKPAEEAKPANPPKEVSSSPMKEYLNRLGKRNTTSEGSIDSKEGSNETWKIFHDFKFKIAQAVEDIKTRSVEETKEKSVPRENSMSDSEESSAIKDSDQQSVGDTDNQVSSLDSSIQNLSEMTQPITAKPTEREISLPLEKNNSESSDDTHKNLANSESIDGTGDLLDDSSMMEVESGVEALEDTNIDLYGDISPLSKDIPDNPTEIHPQRVQRPITPANFNLPPSNNNIRKPESAKMTKHYFLNYSMYILTFLVVVNYILFPNSNVWNGFLMGLWVFCFASNLKQWTLDNYFSDSDPGPSFFQLKRSSAMPPTYTIPSIKEYRPLKKYEGWINHYRVPEYDPYTYHINKTVTAYVKLEGCNLRLSYTTTKIAKRALWDEKIEKVVFYQHRLYNLTGARVILLPKGLVKKRQWSKKYPICIVLNEKEKIQILERENMSVAEKKVVESTTDAKKKEQLQQESESTETNTSPEKKRKFVWRRRDKSITHTEAEALIGKEGLRHRIVRKMHRDKRIDSMATTIEPEIQTDKPQATTDKPQATTDKPQTTTDKLLEESSVHEEELASGSVSSTKEDDEELDETEMSRLKELLDEAEQETIADGTADGEWSVHVKRSKGNHSHLFLFGRTGRDKHEWYRRINVAIFEANAGSAESSVTEDRPASEPAPDTREVETAVYKVSEKESVAFGKSTKSNSVSVDASPIPTTNTNSTLPHLPDLETYERTFWPYLIKIMQPKAITPPCHCRMLPTEVTWVNTVLARLIYDVMRDPAMIMRVQHRIQRKLNTLKLPSFMSPLLVTELSLAGACPLVERVAAPAWDERGVWLDADLRYDGGACITILTQINLMKLKEKNLTLEEQLLVPHDNVVERDTNTSSTGGLFSELQLRKRKPAIFDSDVEDSAESSSDDESPPAQHVDSSDALPVPESQVSTVTPESGSSKKKFLRMVDKISTNKYFQQVTDFKYIKRAMEGLSNTDIKLQLEIQGLEGRLALNLPPPPHDRLWIGFRTNPQLVLKARPAVGARNIRFAHISNWIEHKLSKEFEKVLVLPNMEDISVDVMTPTPVLFE